MKIVAYFRASGPRVPPIVKQRDNLFTYLPDAKIVKRFAESGGVDPQVKLVKAIATTEKLSATLAIPAMFRDRKTLEMLHEAHVPVWPDVGAALKRFDEANAKRRRSMQRAKARGVKFGAARDSFDPAWRDTYKAGVENGKRKREAFLDYYTPFMPCIDELRDKGFSYSEIAEALNEDGHVTSQGNPFTRGIVFNILKRFEG